MAVARVKEMRTSSGRATPHEQVWPGLRMEHSTIEAVLKLLERFGIVCRGGGINNYLIPSCLADRGGEDEVRQKTAPSSCSQRGEVRLGPGLWDMVRDLVWELAPHHDLAPFSK